MRRQHLSATAAVALIATTALTGCSSSTQGDDCEPLLYSGPLSASVQLSGETAADLKVKLNADAEAFDAQRTVVREASQPGKQVQSGSIVSLNLVGIDSTSGQFTEMSETFGTGKGAYPVLADQTGTSISAGIVCAHEGDTLAIALTPEESMGIGSFAPVVYIAEIVDVHEPRAAGKQRQLPTGFPAVAADADGRPGIVLPPQKAPSSERSALRIRGTGEAVTDDQQVIAQVLTVDWNGNEVGNTWKSGPVNIGAVADIPTTTATYRAAITGAPVGSQVVVIEPATGDAPALVSVIDVIAVL